MSARDDPALEYRAISHGAAKLERAAEARDPRTPLTETEVEAVVGEPVVAKNVRPIFGESVCVYFSKDQEDIPLEKLQEVLQTEIDDLFLEVVFT